MLWHAVSDVKPNPPTGLSLRKMRKSVHRALLEVVFALLQAWVPCQKTNLHEHTEICDAREPVKQCFKPICMTLFLSDLQVIRTLKVFVIQCFMKPLSMPVLQEAHFMQMAASCSGPASLRPTSAIHSHSQLGCSVVADGPSGLGGSFRALAARP